MFTQNGQEKTLEELGSEAMESKDFINNTLPGILDEIKAQLDGQIEQHFYQIDPSPLSTAPGSEDGVPNSGWTDANTKEKALETYYSTFDEENIKFDKEMIKAASQTAVVSGGRYEH